MMISFLCDSDYLVFPVNRLMTKKKLIFRRGGEVVWDLNVCLDYDRPEYLCHIDVRRFAGQELTLECRPEARLEIRKSGEPCEPCSYSEAYRPAVHFSPRTGWMNDPNGLYQYKGKYHLFFQHNPAGPVWDNMSWGHAVSADLIHWKELGCALLPDEYGAVFSGSAVVDSRNDSGLKDGDDDPILLFYTAAGGSSLISEGKPFCQRLVYSTDGGKIWRPYAGNPVIPHLAAENRDPKVVFDESTGNYVLALYLDKDLYALFLSRDLLHWEKSQEIALEGDAECPDFYPLDLNGERKWILSGASGRYRIGSFENAVFRPETGSLRLHYGKNAYAAQTWWSPADGRRVRIAWDTFGVSPMPFTNSMGIPTEMSLRAFPEGARLCAKPVRELENIAGEAVSFAAHAAEGDDPAVVRLPGAEAPRAVDLTANLAFSPDADFTLSVFGCDIRFDIPAGKLICGGCEAPLRAEENPVTLRVLSDAAGVELFLAEGSEYLCVGCLADYNLPGFSLSAAHGTADAEVSARSLLRIWPSSL